MRIHHHSRIDFGPRFRVLGFTEVTLYDINHAITPDLTHDELFTLFEEIAPLMATGTDFQPDDIPQDQDIGFRVEEENFQDVSDIIHEGNYHRGKSLNIQSIYYCKIKILTNVEAIFNLI